MSSAATASHPDEIRAVQKDLTSCKNQLDERLLLLEKKLGTLEPLGGDVASSRRDCARLRESQRALQEKVDGQEEKLRQVTASKGRPTSASARYTEGYMADSRITIIERKLEDVERHNSMMKVNISELELQLQASLASTHNGSFLWRIPDVDRRRRAAWEERITSINSPPFYTGRNRPIHSRMPRPQRLSLSLPASLAGHTLSTHSVQWPLPTHPPGHGDHLESTAASTPPHSNTPFQDGTNLHQLGSFIAVLPVEENTREESEGVSPTDPAQRVLSPTQYPPTTSFSSLPPHDLPTGIFPEPLTAQSQGERFSYVGLGYVGFTGEFNG